MTLTQDELQSARELKSQGYSTSEVLGFIAASRADQPSRISRQLTETSTPGRFSDVGEDLVSGVRNTVSDLGDRISNIQTAVSETGKDQTVAETAFQAGGNLIGAVGDIAGNAAVTAGKLVTSQEEEDAISGALGNAI